LNQGHKTTHKYGGELSEQEARTNSSSSKSFTD